MRELSQHILDLLENSLEAGASRVRLEIVEDTAQDRLTIVVADDGRGMDAQTVSRVVDPFYTTRTTRDVGLGIPLLRAAAQRCEGDLTISSEPGVGTTVIAEFVKSHIDRAPLGDMESTLMSVLLSRHDCDLVFEHRVNDRSFGLDTAEIKEILGDLPFTHPDIRRWLQAYIREGYQELLSALKGYTMGSSRLSCYQEGERDAETEISG